MKNQKVINLRLALFFKKYNSETYINQKKAVATARL